jgi:hypothetical protein
LLLPILRRHCGWITWLLVLIGWGSALVCLLSLLTAVGAPD